MSALAGRTGTACCTATSAANVFLCRVGEGDGVHVKVLDFGLARARGNVAITNYDRPQWIGTPQYMSPEQIRGEAEPGEKADVWGMAAVLYELATGKPAFVGGIDQLIKDIGNRRPVPVRVLREDAPEEFADAIESALSIRSGGPPDRGLAMRRRGVQRVDAGATAAEEEEAAEGQRTGGDERVGHASDLPAAGGASGRSARLGEGGPGARWLRSGGRDVGAGMSGTTTAMTSSGRRRRSRSRSPQPVAAGGARAAAQSGAWRRGAPPRLSVVSLRRRSGQDAAVRCGGGGGRRHTAGFTPVSSRWRHRVAPVPRLTPRGDGVGGRRLEPERMCVPDSQGARHRVARRALPRDPTRSSAASTALGRRQWAAGAARHGQTKAAPAAMGDRSPAGQRSRGPERPLGRRLLDEPCGREAGRKPRSAGRVAGGALRQHGYADEAGLAEEDRERQQGVGESPPPRGAGESASRSSA
jgi:hypothetical protein